MQETRKKYQKNEKIIDKSNSKISNNNNNNNVTHTFHLILVILKAILNHLEMF